MQYGYVLPECSSTIATWTKNMLDPALWPNDAQTFRPERWLEKPEAPLFTYGLGYRSCTGISLANRLLYLFYLRLIAGFEISVGSEIDVHPVSGCKSAEDLVSSPRRYTVVFRPRDEARLAEALR
jgi:3-hydroxyphenylacetate 6-hydroxylase